MNRHQIQSKRAQAIAYFNLQLLNSGHRLFEIRIKPEVKQHQTLSVYHSVTNLYSCTSHLYCRKGISEIVISKLPLLLKTWIEMHQQIFLQMIYHHITADMVQVHILDFTVTKVENIVINNSTKHHCLFHSTGYLKINT